MYPVSEEFLAALENETVHHIRGRILDVTGAVTELADSLTGNIRTESQCVTDSMQFGFGGMYVGTVECSLDLPYSMKDNLKGGLIKIEFGAELSSGGIEWIPLGVWEITECTRESSSKLKISGMDMMKKLLTDTEPRLQGYVGVLHVEDLMKHVTELTGVEFAQTIDELQMLVSWNLGTIWATRYGATAWAEVKAIAQIMGCFAFANREGKIEFRRLDNTAPVITIPADRRHNCRLEEYTYTVKGVKYTDSQGYSVTRCIDGADEAGAVVGFSDCVLVWETDEEFKDSQYRIFIDRITPNLAGVNYTPGTIDYYGNPALEPGDYVIITGGTAEHSGDVRFLICCNTWQFRAPQTLTACGFSEVGASDFSSGASKESQQIRTVNITKSVANVPLLGYAGELFPEDERIIARGGFSCRAQTCCYIVLNAVFYGTETDCTYNTVYVDEVAQSFRPTLTVRENEYTTLHFQVPLTAEPGVHTVEVGACGSCSTEQIEAYVWGQNLTEVYPEPTGTEDYIYEISGGEAEVIEYIGKSNSPEIPQSFEGAQTAKIGSNAFTYSTVENVYIPDGVAEIE